MKKFYLILLCAVFISIQYGCEKTDDTIDTPDTPDAITDSRDGQVYTTVKIGEQTWFSQNLNYHAPGSVKNYETVNTWWYENSEKNGEIYGSLYTWEAALTACPSGWHLPSKEEWKDLLIKLGVNQSEFIYEGWVGIDVGKRMKSTSLWSDGGNGTNSSNFNALPGGSYNPNSSFMGLGTDAFFWSSSDWGGDAAYEYDIRFCEDRIYYGHFTKSIGRSVRCVKDK
jgi:uncharacterized protein (TIGR02145 family)